MKSNLRSLLAATGLGLAIATSFAIAQSPSPSAGDTLASQGTGGHHAGRKGGRDGMEHAGREADRTARREAMDKLTTAEERAAFRETMRSATPESRRQLMEARRAELQQRATERGVVLPAAQPRGERSGDRDGARHGQRGDHHRSHAGQTRRGDRGGAASTPAPALESM